MLIQLHPNPATKKVTVAIPSDETVVNNKQAKDIQSNIVISADNKVTGKSKYVSDITNAGGEGNYLVLELPQAKDSENTVTCKFEGGKATKLSPEDYQYLMKLKNKKPVVITVQGKENATVTLDISSVELEAKAE